MSTRKGPEVTLAAREAARDSWLLGLERWRSSEELDVPLWHRRTLYMARGLFDWLSRRGEADRPLELYELGCGAMALEAMLPEVGLARVRYRPCDAFPRDGRTRVVDLEDAGAIAELPLHDVAFVAGVLEYLRDPVATVAAIARRARLVTFCYCPRFDGASERARRGWKSHLSAAELEAGVAPLGELERDDGFGDPAAPPVVVHRLAVASEPGGRGAP